MTACRTLIVVESGYGTTAQIADHIGARLGAAGHAVDVRQVGEVGDVDRIDGYDLIVVGGAIRYDRWMRGAAEFVRAHRADLSATSTAFFFTCLALSKPSERSTRTADQYESRIRTIAPELDPLTVGRFAGAVDPARMNPLLRIAARAFLAVRGVGAGDHRDWNAIDAWTDHLTVTFAERSGRPRTETV